jgi:alkylation response protein AidB-like acyl-CoA dehydrogenase
VSASSSDDFRAEFRAWLDANGDDAPRPAVLGPLDDDDAQRRRRWQAQLADAGYLGTTWPTEYGGRGGEMAERIVVEQELEARGLAGPLDFIGVDIVGPTILEHARLEQQRRLLPGLLRGDKMWCQLLSEPGAGSDLAAVQTRAQRANDGTWLVNGQKVWTSFAHQAAWGLLLARTDPEAPRHRGLTAFAVPMSADGITIRPLRQVTGDAEFNEVFLDDVQLPADAAIGAPGDGWRVTLTMLSFERMSVGTGLTAVRLDRLIEALADRDLDRDQRVRLGEVASELLALRHTSSRIVEGVAEGVVPGPEAGLVKITTIAASLDACRLAVDVLGPAALTDSEWGRQVSALPGLRSAGGTEEILRNVIGDRVLGLPSEPRVAI